MPKAADLKRGTIVEIEGEVYIAKHVEVKSPSSRSGTTLYKVRFSNVRSKQKRDETYKGDDMLAEVDFIKRPVQYSYRDGDGFVFMDSEDFSQYVLSEEDLEDQAGYLHDGLDGITALLVDDQLLGIELPQSVALEIVETAPAIKGASATGRTKAATLSTGIEVQVPEYLTAGERVKVNTETGKFMARA